MIDNNLDQDNINNESPLENNLIDDNEPIIEETCIIGNRIKHKSKGM